MTIYKINQSESSYVRHIFSRLRTERNSYRMRSDLSRWEEMLFHSLASNLPNKKRISNEQIIFEAYLSQDHRKPIHELALKSVRL